MSRGITKDFNTATTIGTYSYDGSGGSNLPTTWYGLLTVYKSHLNYLTQDFHAGDGKRFYRLSPDGGTTWQNWSTTIQNSDLENPFRTELLHWGFYTDGTYTLLGSIVKKRTAITVGVNGRLRSEWTLSAVNDIRSIIIPGGIINIKIISETQVQISGTTEEFRVRDIRTL